MALNVLFSGIGVVIKLLCGLMTNKILSVQLGPAAFGVWGNVFSLTTLYMAFSNGGISQGLIAKLSSPNQSAVTRDSWLAGGLFFAIATPLLITGVHLGFRQSNIVADSRFLSPASTIILALSAAFALHIQAAVLSTGKVRLNSIIVSISGPIALTAYWSLVRPNSIQSAVDALVTGTSAILLLWWTAAQTGRVKWRPKLEDARPAWHTLRELLPYVAIALAPAVIGTSAIITVRETISNQINAEAAGLWQGIFRLSDATVALAQAVVSYALMPEVFRTSSPHQALRARYGGYALLVFGGFIIGVLVLSKASESIVRLLYSSHFSPISSLLWIELFGDTLKSLALPFVAYFIYKRNLRFSWMLELLFSLSFVIFCKIFIQLIGLSGAVWAYVAANCLLLITAGVYFLRSRNA